MKRPGPLLDRTTVAAAAGVFGLLFALYACTACRTIGPGDSGELTVAMTSWGVPHAPGYPLLSLLGNCVTLLTGRAHAAFALNLLNALFAAAAAGCITLAVAVSSRDRRAGAVAGLALGVSPAFWSQALAVEVVSLNALVAAVMLALFAGFIAEREQLRRADWALVGLAACLTTAVTHHATIVLLGLPLAVVCAWSALRERRAVPSGRVPLALAIALALALGAGLLPLLYLPLAASHDPPLNWGNATSLPALARLLLRRDFGAGVLIAPPITAGEILAHGVSADPAGGKHLWFFLSQLPRQLGWILALGALVAIYDAARKRRALFVVILLFALTQLYFLLRVNTPLTPLYLAATERFHVLPQVFVAFLGGIGLASVAGRAGARARPAGSILLMLAAVESLGVNVALHPVPDMHRNTFTGELGRNLLAGMPPSALAFTDGDMFRNSALYAQVDEGIRPDVKLVDPVLMASPWYVTQLRRRHTMVLPDTMTVYSGAPGTDVRSWLDVNMESASGARPIVAVRMIDDSWVPAYQQLPMGLWSETRRRGAAVDLADWSRRFSQVVAGWRPESIARHYPAGSWEENQTVFYRYGLGCLQAVRDMAAAYAPAPETLAAVPALEQAKRWQGSERADFLAYQADQWRSCLEDSLVPATAAARRVAFDHATQLAEQALAVDPTDLQGLQTLAWCRERSGDAAAEVGLRHRIVSARPGDTVELMAYFAAVARARDGRVPRYDEMVSEAEAVRVRAMGVIAAAEAHWPDPRLTRLRQQLSLPLAR